MPKYNQEKQNTSHINNGNNRVVNIEYNKKKKKRKWKAHNV